MLAGGGAAGACVLAALLGVPGEGVISPLLPHADNASAAAISSPAVIEPFIWGLRCGVGCERGTAAASRSTFHGETVIPRSHTDPTQASVDISESLRKDRLNIAAPGQRRISAQSAQASRHEAGLRLLPSLERSARHGPATAFLGSRHRQPVMVPSSRRRFARGPRKAWVHAPRTRSTFRPAKRPGVGCSGRTG